MDSEITTTIITIVVAGAMQLILRFFQKKSDKKKEAAALEKSASEIDNTDSETIQNLIDSIDRLQGLHEEERKKSQTRAEENENLCQQIKKQANQISILETSYKILGRQNEKLLRENEEMKKAILDLTVENAALRKLITDEQIKKDLDGDE